MPDKSNTEKSNESKMTTKKKLIITGTIILVGVVLMIIIFSTEPTASREGATKETAMLVEVNQVERGDFRPTIVATGTVAPEQDIVLSPQISGEVIRLSSSFTPGGFVKKGDVLLQIDPLDYENIVEQRMSDLNQALADLNIEMGRQKVAQKDYQLLDEELTEENKSLVLREPQLETARARVEAARAALKQAEVDLWRTTIRAPFDAHIINRNVNVGSQVSPGIKLARLVGIDAYWIVTTVPLSHIKWLTFPAGKNETGSKVIIRNRTAWSEDDYRTGYLYKLIGALEDQTRMARVLVRVEDPLVHKSTSSGLPPLMIGSFVETNILGDVIENVIKLNRDYLRKDDKVWVMEDSLLHIKDVEVVFRDDEYAYIKSGLNENDKIVTTNLSTVTDGARLRVENTNGNKTLRENEVETDTGDGN